MRILQRRQVSPTGTQREPSLSGKATAREGAEPLESSAEEPPGVGGAGGCERRRWHRGGLLRSAAHRRRHCGYQPQGAVPSAVGGEVGGGHRTGDRRDNRARWEGRASTSARSSEEVSDGACPKRANPPTANARELQRSRYFAAKRSRNRRCQARYARIVRPARRWRVWQDVRANGGAAGSDGVTIDEVERQGVEQFWEPLRQDLRAGPYGPQPVRRVHSPKPDGGQRPLGTFASLNQFWCQMVTTESNLAESCVWL
jgi:hypothetical protein